MVGVLVSSGSPSKLGLTDESVSEDLESFRTNLEEVMRILRTEQEEDARHSSKIRRTFGRRVGRNHAVAGGLEPVGSFSALH